MKNFSPNSYSKQLQKNYIFYILTHHVQKPSRRCVSDSRMHVKYVYVYVYVYMYLAAYSSALTY